MQAWYCSPECQKAHWKGGGHKIFCKGMNVANAIIVRAAAEKSRSLKADDTCIICLNEDPPPIQSGCACRGNAGLAHVACRAEAAVHSVASSMTFKGWWECATCLRDFTGAMQMGLALTWWSHAQRLPKQSLDYDSNEWDCAASQLCLALNSHGKSAETVLIARELFFLRSD